MAIELKLRRGSSTENDSFTGSLGEVTVDTTNNTLRVHDGSTLGGTESVSLVGSQVLENKTLSSPEFTGQITGDLIPSVDVTYDLGSASNRWNDLYLSGNTIDIGGATISVTNGSFEFKDSGGNDAEVSLAANTTDDLSEGSSNLYYTDSRVRNAVSVSGDLSYDSDTGTFSFTERTDSEVRGLLSAAGDLSYDNATGEFSVTTYKSANFDTDFVNKSSDDLSEGTTNLYYTDTRTRNAVSAAGDLSYNSSTGEFSFTERTDAEVRGLFSASGDLSYNSSTGEFTVTVPAGYDSSDFDTDFSNKSTSDLSEGTNLYYTDARVDAHLSGGSGIDFSTGTISHSDTSTVGDVTSSSNTFVDALTFDDFGHVTAVSTSTAAPPNNATITVSAGGGLTGGGNFTTDQSINETISLDVDTSTIATRSYVDTEVANLVDSSPATLDTLNELAAALGDDPNFATTVSNDIGTKAAKTTDINAGSGLTGGGDLSANRTISHANTSSVGDVSAMSNTFIDGLTFDTFGHVTGVTTSSAAPPNNASITINAGNDLSGGGTFTTDQSGNETITIDHGNTSNLSGTYGSTSNSTKIDNITVDANGHVTSITTGATGDITSVSSGSGLSGGGSSGGVTLSHADTSSQGSVNNSGNTFIQDITVDGFGHITNINSGSVSGFAQENTAVTFTTVTATDFNSTSDVRKKKNAETITDASTKVSNLRGVSFDWIENDESSIGLIAQELEEVIPEVVSTSEDGFKSVSYGNLVGLLVEAIKDQQNQIDELKNKVYK